MKTTVLTAIFLGTMFGIAGAAELLTKKEMAGIRGRCFCDVSTVYLSACKLNKSRNCYGCDAGQVEIPGFAGSGLDRYTRCDFHTNKKGKCKNLEKQLCGTITLCEINLFRDLVCDPNTYRCVDQNGGTCTASVGSNNTIKVEITNQTCE